MEQTIKILTWNCSGALRKKFNSISELDADIYVIQECEDPEISNDKNYKEWSKNYLWTGDNKNRGLGVFSKDVKMENLCWETNGLKYFISCRFNNDFNLLATWCHGANSPTFGYIGQLWKYLQINKLKLANCIIAGDFNSNKIWDRWDRWWNHSDVIRELAEIKIESLYHTFYGEEQGKESQPTFFLHWRTEKPYHIDYIFGSERFSKSVKSMTIGKPEHWLGMSDHMPVMINIELTVNTDV